MQDKIQEIMGLVTQHAYIYYSAATGGCRDSDDVKESERSIESKLRELVREPLSDEEVDALWVFCGNLTVPQKVQRRIIARTVEAAHNITNTGGVE